MTLETLQQFLKDRGLSPNKTYGQHFLMDDLVIERMIESAEVTSHDIVLEIGPGIGNLTEKLLQGGARVLSIEKDEQFLPVLNRLKKLYPDQFFYLNEDVLGVNLSEVLQKLFNKDGLNQGYKIVANIPYYITGKIIQHALKQDIKPSSLTLLVQKEVAQNLSAKPGQKNLLALSVDLHGLSQLVEVVPARSFYPAPKVDSAVVKITLSLENQHRDVNEKELFRLMKACFAGKRKQIHNTLKNNYRLSADQVEQVLNLANLKKQARPQQLGLRDWIVLMKAVQNLED